MILFILPIEHNIISNSGKTYGLFTKYISILISKFELKLAKNINPNFFPFHMIDNNYLVNKDIYNIAFSNYEKKISLNNQFNDNNITKFHYFYPELNFFYCTEKLDQKFFSVTNFICNGKK